MSEIEILRVIVTEFPYALLGSVLGAVLCSYLGVYIVSKRVVFLGATLTEVAVAGIAFAHLPFIGMNPVLGSLLFVFAIVLVFSRLLENRILPRESSLGITFALAIAFRILMVQKSPAAEAAEVEAILKGDILFVTPESFYLLLGVFVVVMALHRIFYKEFLFVLLDAETAQTQGFRSHRWELFFYLTAGVGISVATRVLGDIFVFGFLVIPSIAALLIGRTVSRVFLYAVLLAIVPPIIGLYEAFKLDLPAGPTTVAVAFALLVLGWLMKKLRQA